MTDDHKPAHPAVAPKPAAKPANKQPMAKKAAPKPKANLPAIPSVNIPMTPPPQNTGVIAAAAAVTLGAGALIGHAISRMFLRR